MKPVWFWSSTVAAILFASATSNANSAGIDDGLQRTFGDVSVVIRTAEVPKEFTRLDRPGAPAYSSISVLIVQFELRVNGKSVFVPLDAYAGLGDPSDVDVKEEKLPNNLRRLSLRGGDASTSYCAKFDFNATQVLQVNLYRDCKTKTAFIGKRYAKLQILD
jgi:hypothetical protein